MIPGHCRSPLFEPLERRLLLNGTIEGQIWEDLNGNGARDAGEPGIDGCVVELLDASTGESIATEETFNADMNGDGAIDPTLESGFYRFEGLPLSEYVVRQVISEGWMQTGRLLVEGDVVLPDVAFRTHFNEIVWTTDPFHIEEVHGVTPWDAADWLDWPEPRPWTWKLNSAYYSDTWVNNRGNPFNGWFNPEFLVAYEPGPNPDSYWFLIGDSFPGGHEPEDDFYDLDVEIVESHETAELVVTAYHRASVSEHCVLGPYGQEHLVPTGPGVWGDLGEPVTVVFDMLTCPRFLYQCE